MKIFDFFKLLSVAIVLLAGCFEANAKWEMLRSQRAPYCMHITPEGNILVADYLFDETGGIYLSEDQGATWVKTDAPDYTYGKFIDAGEYVIATGAKCRVARSKDGGKSWEVTNYASAIVDIVGERITDNTICYTATMHGNRLYIGDFGGGGVLYTEDFGETWVLTDLESLQYEAPGKDGTLTKMTETIYNVVSYKDNLYAFGVYYIYRYDEVNDKWIVLRDDSNFMAQSTIFNGMLLCGRSVMDQTPENPFIVTFDGSTWGDIKRPTNMAMVDNNIRSLESDDTHIYVAFQQSGIFTTCDNGENWYNISEGLPSDKTYEEFYQHTIDLEEDKDYLYVVVYDIPTASREIDGIYRFPKSKIKELSSKLDITNSEEAVYCDGEYLYVGECNSVVISDLFGRTFEVAVVDGKVSLQGLANGVYVYNVDNAVAGKFIKK